MTAFFPARLPARPLADLPAERTSASLVSVGLATPELGWPQDRIADVIAARCGMTGEALERWQRINHGSGIAQRHAVMPIEQVIDLTTAQRMAAYERFAPDLASQAAVDAMRSALVDARRVTELIVVSCTGFSAPGVDVEIVRRLGLRPTVRRTIVGFMGCFGAIVGLRTAAASCAAHAGSVALVVCVELCSLHLRRSLDPQNLVASALFADGAAAAVVCSADHPSISERGQAASVIGGIGSPHGLLLDEGRDWMRWTITDAGFAMTLTREVPIALRQALALFVDDACGGTRPVSYAIHPGGPGILDAAESALDLRGGGGLQASRAILNRCGNMSSGTVLFVLDEALRQGHRLPAMLLAFGPGLTIESLLILPG